LNRTFELQGENKTTLSYIIDDFSLKIKEGETIAIVGESGAGKSTLIKLLFRLYDINNGSIKINNIEIDNITQKSLRKNIGVVPQDTILFNTSILFNLTYGSY